MTSIHLDGREIRLDWKLDGETYRFRIESEEERVADIRQVAPTVYSVLVGGRTYQAIIDGNSVSIGGHTFAVEVLDPRRWKREQNQQAGEGRQNIAASMPGKVIRVLVSAGDEVEAGQGLIVVEAMKMQNEMKAARAGIVATLTAREGATVGAGEVLATIE